MKQMQSRKRMLWTLFLAVVLSALFSGKAGWSGASFKLLAAEQESNKSEQGTEHGDLQELYPAEEQKEPVKETRKQQSDSGKWKSRNQKVFYYENGKKVTGVKKIGQKYYYFSDNGIQRTGWQKINGDYYFFKIANAQKGYMQKSQTVNDIKLSKNGKAKLTAASTAKLDALIKANKILEKAVKPEMEKSEKLKRSFDYLLKHYQYRGSPIFQLTGHWELDYALDVFDEGHGSCYAFGAAFAFLANAAGYKNCYAVSSGGHGWAEVGGKVYDPTWSLVDKTHSYYGVSFSLSGRDGRPNYKNARRYVVKI